MVGHHISQTIEQNTSIGRCHFSPVRVAKGPMSGSYRTINIILIPGGDICPGRTAKWIIRGKPPARNRINELVVNNHLKSWP
jgi:hypothetical protein